MKLNTKDLCDVTLDTGFVETLDAGEFTATIDTSCKRLFTNIININ